MKLTITVTKEILERSKMCGTKGLLLSENCAIALAVRDVFPGAAIGNPDWAPFPGDMRNLPLPPAAVAFIYKFDNTEPERRPCLPEFSFDIELPDWVVERIDISELAPLLENHPTLKLEPATA